MKYLHFSEDHYFIPSSDTEEVPEISIKYGGLFVYILPDEESDLREMWKVWGYRFAYEVIVPAKYEGAVMFNLDAPADRGELYAEYIIPFEVLEHIRCYRIDL